MELAEGFRPQVILMDVAMPELDGAEATRVIRLRPWGAGVHIIALTAWGQESERRRTREAGMDGHLVKPVGPKALAGGSGVSAVTIKLGTLYATVQLQAWQKEFR